MAAVIIGGMAASTHPAVQLRTARLDDLSELLRLAREFYDEDGFTTSDDELELNFRALFAAPDSAHICLAGDGESPVGFALTTTALILESGLVAELQDLYVMPSHRGGGLGAQLMQEAEQWAKGQGAALLEIVVAPNGQDVSGLLRYYARHGFRDEGRRLISLEL
jgi:aminoglycoside 6'-N-acetyltransferase I